MRQNHYCPNCGTPVTCGDRFCMGCGVNFQWIAPSELEQCSPVSYKLPHPGQEETPGHHLLEQTNQASQQAEASPAQAAEKNSVHSQEQASVLKAEVSKLLESFFGSQARCHKA
jgi:hypothetical protein